MESHFFIISGSSLLGVGFAVSTFIISMKGKASPQTKACCFSKLANKFK